ncbi:hypothetical protein ACFQ3Q_09010 [Salegentibacter chungangensis]|uniref:Uncharacterized protein n=1 Tax=Salegentibacter chungangensis TaxID=1335724 RepID=A0ABW3NT05_9FLAO
MQNRDNNCESTEEYIIQKSRKNGFGTFYVLVILIILATIIAVTGVFFNYW